MIKLSDKWSLTSDPRQWILTEVYEGKNKDGEVKHHSRCTYHSTLHQVSSYLVNQEAKEAITLNQLIEECEKIVVRLQVELEKVT